MKINTGRAISIKGRQDSLVYDIIYILGMYCTYIHEQTLKIETGKRWRLKAN
jgi:hypothetical protein